MIAQIITYNAVNTGLLVAQPNWDTEVTVTLELPVQDIGKEPITLQESRRTFAAVARYSMKWTCYLSNVADSAELRIFLTRIRAEPILVPLWADVCELATGVTGGATTLTLFDLPVRYGVTWLIAYPDFADPGFSPPYEILNVGNINSSTKVATLGSAIGHTWPAGTFLWPMIMGRLTDRPKPESITDESLEVEFTVQESSDFSMRVSPISTTGVATVGGHIPSFAAIPLLDVAPNFSRPLDWTEMPDVVYEHIGFLRQDQQRVYDHRNPRGQELEFYLNNRADVQKLEYFWRDRRASTKRFCVPTWRGDMRMQQDTPVAGHATWIVCDYNEYGDAGREAQPGDPFVALIGPAAIISDGYSEANTDATGTLYTGSGVSLAQSFTGNGGLLYWVLFFIGRVGAPPGNVVAKLYTHTGTFGTTSLPGTLLATSDPIVAGALGTSFALTQFAFPSQPVVTAGTNYCIAVEYIGGNSSNAVVAGYDSTSGTHVGNLSNFNGTTWVASSSTDLPFWVYTFTQDIIDPYQLSGTTDAPAAEPIIRGDVVAPDETVIGDDGLVIVV